MFQIEEDAACVFWQEPDLDDGTGEVLRCHVVKHRLKQYLCLFFFQFGDDVCFQDIGAQRVVIPTSLELK